MIGCGDKGVEGDPSSLCSVETQEGTVGREKTHQMGNRLWREDDQGYGGAESA